jgi:hypothetical protein
MGVRTRRQATGRGDRNETNIGLLAFKIAVNEGLTIYNLVDGVVDEFNDQSGISTPQSPNAFYDATCDYYSNGECLAAATSVFSFSEGPSPLFTDGQNQTYTAPRDGDVELLIWGSAGGSGGNNYNPTGSGTYGGGGGFTRVEVPVLEGDALTVAVGAFGRAGPVSSVNDGGGFSGVFTGYTPTPNGNSGYSQCAAIAIAGGGGGGRHSAGGGGGTNGQPGSGAWPSTAGSFGNGIAGGGSQCAAGGPSPGTAALETPGQAFYGGGWQGLGSYYLGGGGTAPQAPTGFSGGGGGGYYGGGAGQGGDNSGGGGGSGYIGGTPEHPVSKAVTITGSSNLAAYTTLAGTPNAHNGPSPTLAAPNLTFTYSPDVPGGSGMPTTFDAAADALGVHPQYPQISNDNTHPFSSAGNALPRNADASSNVVGGGTGGVVVNLAATSTLQSTATLTSAPFGTADSSIPTTARIVVFAEIASEVLNTDIVAKVSRDNGANYSNVTLLDGGFVSGTSGQKIYTGSVDVSGQPSGNELRYQIAGSSLSETIKIHGVALQWS